MRGLTLAVGLASLCACTARPATTPAPVAASDPGAAPEPAPPAEKPAEVNATEPAAPEPEPKPDPASEPTAQDDPYPPPLTEEQKAIFFGTKEDKPAEHRGGVTPAQFEKQYVAGNEHSLFTYYEDVRDLGGGYIGVGSDQAYLFIGWAKPEFAWLIDYDDAVVTVHGVYRSFFLAAETPQDLARMWSKAGYEDGLAAIDAHNTPRRAKKLRRLYSRSRGWVNRRIRAQVRRMKEAKVPSFLTDQENFDYIREMYRRERIRPMVTNLLENGAFRGVVKAAGELGVTVRMLYLSNAEQYWKSGYNRSFRKNVRALPVDDKSLLVRTLLIWDVNRDYRYNTQPLANYQEWLAMPYVRSVYHIVHSRPKARADIVNKLHTNGDPADSPIARRTAKEQKRAAKKSKAPAAVDQP